MRRPSPICKAILAPDVVYCENDNMCFGVMQALDELGIAYGTGGVTLISFDSGAACAFLL